MKKSYLFVILILTVSFFSACTSEINKIKAKGDTKAIYNKAFELYEKKKYAQAQELFEIVLNNYRGKAEAEKLYFAYSYTHYHMKNFILASYYFKNFASTFVNSKNREEAEFMSAYSTYLMSPSYRLEQSNTSKAIAEFEQFTNTYPQSTRVDKCNALIDELRKKLEKKAFEEGKLYFDMKEYQASIHSLENLLKEFPETSDADRVKYMILKSKYELAINSILSKQEERFKDVAETANEYTSKNPSSKFSKEIKSIQKIANQQLKELKHERNQNKSTGS